MTTLKPLPTIFNFELEAISTPPELDPIPAPEPNPELIPSPDPGPDFVPELDPVPASS